MRPFGKPSGTLSTVPTHAASTYFLSYFFFTLVDVEGFEPPLTREHMTSLVLNLSRPKKGELHRASLCNPVGNFTPTTTHLWVRRRAFNPLTCMKTDWAYQFSAIVFTVYFLRQDLCTAALSS